MKQSQFGCRENKKLKVADRLAGGSEVGTSTVLGLPQWSKYKVAEILDRQYGHTQNKYTCDCNCFIELEGTTVVNPKEHYKNVLKVNNTTIKTWDISTPDEVRESESTLSKVFLFKKIDVISLNIDTYYNGGETIIKLNILPLE